MAETYTEATSAPPPTVAEALSFVDGQLSVVGCELTHIPADIVDQYAARTTALDLSYNAIVKLDNIASFTRLERLTADNNSLVAEQPFPVNEHLKALSLNNNEINDLQLFMDLIVESFPSLTYLSLLKNPACPNPLIGKDQDEYRRYRLYVVFRIPKLKFLDSTKVTDEERSEAKLRGEFLVVAKPSARAEPEEAKDTSDLPPPLPSDTRPVGETRASFGRSRYVYYGRQSEGNRFILNSDL